MTDRFSKPRGPILAVDPGSERVGLALSDEAQTLAFPHATLSRRALRNAGENLVCAIVRIAREQQASRIVVGLPLRLDGSEGPAAARARRFAEALAQAGSPAVTLVDERLTTVEAERRLREAGLGPRARRARRDAAAATVLLQAVLGSGVHDHEGGEETPP